MSSIDAILFDLGGTLDGRGGWRERFHRLFEEVGLEQYSHDARTAAFDFAERCSHATPGMGPVGLRPMVEKHVGWQLDYLGQQDPAARRRLVDRFVADARDAADINRPILATLAAGGFRLGLVSNACGNAAVLCDDYGYRPMLTAIVDSHLFGRSKPDPAIFLHALLLVGADPDRTAFVGDSFDRDIQPAKQLGMRTFWIASRPPQPEEEAVADAVIHSLADLPARLQQFT